LGKEDYSHQQTNPKQCDINKSQSYLVLIEENKGPTEIKK